MIDYKKIEQIEAILEAKEERFKRQKELTEKYKNTLISFTLNIPGEIKSSDKTKKFQKKYIYEIENILSENNIDILFKEYRERPTGDEYFAVIDAEAVKVKKLMIALEESSEETRLLDIDVFDKSIRQISRVNLSYAGRRCLICEKEAKYCIRQKNHSIEELVAKTEEILNR